MIKKFLDLGMQPLANKYLTKSDLIKRKREDFYHLEIGFNTKDLTICLANFLLMRTCHFPLICLIVAIFLSSV